MRGLLRRKKRPAFTYTAVRNAESMTDVPVELGSEIILVKRKGTQLWAVLMCPCGCGERINVNLMRTADPHWMLSVRRGKISLSPSLWVSPKKCGSHFWLIDNGVFWCPRRSHHHRNG